KPQAATSPVGGGAATLSTVTETPADVATLPAPSRATAVRVCVPFALVRVSQVAANGGVVSSDPSAAPPPASVADAVTAMDPETVAPAAGAVIATAGGVVSAVTTALASADGGPRF